METRVVNVKKEHLKSRGIADMLEWSLRPDSLYIGRAMPFVPGATANSKWANPFSVERYGRVRCLEMFEKYVRGRRDLWDSLEEIEGKEVGCWCFPASCHGEILIRLLAEKKTLMEKVEGDEGT